MPIDQAKLKALKAQGPAKVGGQRVAKPAAKAEKTGAAADAAKVSQAVNRLGGKAIPNVSEVWMFVGNDQTLQFNNPKVTAAVQCNTWAITGKPVKKPVAECFTQALPHMGLDNMGALQQLLGAMGGMGGMGGGMPGMPGMGGMPGMPGMGMPGMGGMPGMPGMGGMPDMAAMMASMGMNPDDVPNFDEAGDEPAPDLVD